MTDTLPPAVTPATDDGILDFTPPAEDTRPKRFRIGPEPDDVFTAAASIPVLISADFSRGMAGLRDATDETAALDGVLGLFRQVLYPEDADRFIDRCRDIKRPVDHRTLMRIMDGLLERWGLRPPEPSESSSDGQPSGDDGNSTGGGQLASVSTLPENPSTASSTSSTPSSPTLPTPPTSGPPGLAPIPPTTTG